jgi:hypothetical protein
LLCGHTALEWTCRVLISQSAEAGGA